MAKLKVYKIDGYKFSSFDEFVEYISKVLFNGYSWRGNLDTFNDMLGGGYGTPENGFIIEWSNSARSKEVLGKYHSSTNRRTAMFDVIISIIEGNGPASDYAKENYYYREGEYFCKHNDSPASVVILKLK